jgi:hypothetical protein
MRRSLAAAMLLAASLVSADPALAQLCRQKLAESALIGVRLNDPGSAERVLGRGMKAANVPEEDMDRYLSADGRQEIRFIYHGGSGLGEYQAIEVLPATEKASRAPRLATSRITTERGVRLGMTRDELVRLLGPCHRAERQYDGATRIAYRIDDPGHALVRRVGLPVYYAHYDFKNGRLVQFQFGFEAP